LESALRKNKNGPMELTVLKARLEDVMSDIVRVDLSNRPFAKSGRVIGIRHATNRVLAVARGTSGHDKNTIMLDSSMRQNLVLPKTKLPN